jgi:hypothetical protein
VRRQRLSPAGLSVLLRDPKLPGFWIFGEALISLQREFHLPKGEFELRQWLTGGSVFADAPAQAGVLAARNAVNSKPRYA